MEPYVSIDRPPPRVRVEVVTTTGGQTEARIVYRWGSIPRFLLGLLLLAANCIWLGYDRSVATIFCIGGFIVGAAVFLYALFGRLVVKLCPPKGVYSSWFERAEFPLSPRTQVRRIKHVKRKNGQETHWILATDDSLGSVRFGRSFPGSVQDYICACIARLSAGLPLESARGSIWRPNLAHPVLFTFFAVLTVMALVFSTS